MVPRGITIQELAPKFNRTSADLVRILFDAGEMVTSTQSMADEMIELVAQELGAEILLVEPGQEAELELQALLGDDPDEEEETDLPPRAPVVTVMGHVDHGKTTLLDTIRSANVVAGEAGGITQHIGAYQVVRDERPITFIDTPGHEAFTAMRKRGADATDVAVLVVAADDGVMPQTIEAINHARAAEVPIVVAITKVDRDNANPDRVRQQLVEQELIPEEWGGDTVVNEVAASAGIGVDELLESILLVADLYDPPLGANPEAPARAFVLESNLDQGRGPVATVLVERGTLRVGDPVVAGGGWGKVRAMFDDTGSQVKEAGPSTPVEVLGLDDVPLAGDELRVAPNEKVARTVAEARSRRRRVAAQAHPMILAGGARLEDIFAMVERGETATLNLVLKADVNGSLEALTDALRKLDQEHEEVRLSFVHRAVGGISESDINLAAVSNATVIGFNVRPDRQARALADTEKVEMRLYEVIYQVLDDVNNALLGMLKPEFEEVVTGDAEVREIFGVPRIGKIAGCFVRNGVITRGSKVRFLREGTIIWKGSIASLRRFKDDVREVREGFECGIGLENYQDLKPGDIIETYEDREIARAPRPDAVRRAVQDRQRGAPAALPAHARARSAGAGSACRCSCSPRPARKSGAKRSVMLTSPLQLGDSYRARGVARRRRPEPGLAATTSQADPAVEVELDGRTRPMRARVADAAERAELWPRIVADHSNYGSYQAKTDREIPVVVLDPRPDCTSLGVRRRAHWHAPRAGCEDGGRARGRGLLRPPHPGEPVAQGQARRDPPDRRRAAAPLPRLGRRGGPPGPVAAQRDRCRRGVGNRGSSPRRSRLGGAVRRPRSGRRGARRRDHLHGVGVDAEVPAASGARSTTRASRASTRSCSRRWPRSSSGSRTRASAS